MPAFLLLAACCAAPIAAGAIAVIGTLKRGSDPEIKTKIATTPGKRFGVFRKTSQATEGRTK